MEWIVEGVALISIAAFVAVATAIEPHASVSSAVFAVAIATLVTLAAVSIFTGFRIAFLPYRLCPFIFGLSAVLIAVGSMGLKRHLLPSTSWNTCIRKRRGWSAPCVSPAFLAFS